MWPRNWKKLLMLAPISAVFLTACPDGHKRNDPSTAYSWTGVWVNADLYGAYRDLYKTERVRFCKVIVDDPARFGIDQEPYGNELVVVDSWVITSRGEVMVYNPRYRPNDNGYRETYLKGNVDAYGYFRRRNATAVQAAAYGGQFQNTPYYFYYASDARLFMNTTTTMKVWAGNNSREYVRTEDRPGNQEMANIYMAAVSCFSASVTRKAEYPDVGGDGPHGAYPPRPGEEVIIKRGARRRVMVAPPGGAPVPPPPGAVVGGGARLGAPPPPLEGGAPGPEIPAPPPGEEVDK